MSLGSVHNFLPHDGAAYYYPNCLSQEDQLSCFQALSEGIEWESLYLKIFGKEVLTPRLTAFYGDAGLSYSYSGITHEAKPWTDTLIKLKAIAETYAKAEFNVVLLNYYRDGNDSMGWHSDNEAELGQNPCIASLSLGAERSFKMRHKNYKALTDLRSDKQNKFNIRLESGSLLVMKDACQHHWQHAVPKTAKVVEPRINLTFRKIIL